MSLPTNFNQLGNAEASWMKWDLDKWKEEVQSRTENLPPFLRTPDAIKNLTSLVDLFTDSKNYVAGTKFYKGDTLPNWDYANVTDCFCFNLGNTFTVNAFLNAPNCTNVNWAFRGCTHLREATLNLKTEASCECLFTGTSLEKLNYPDNFIFGYVGRMFESANLKFTNDLYIRTNRRSIPQIFNGTKFANKINITVEVLEDAPRVTTGLNNNSILTNANNLGVVTLKNISGGNLGSLGSGTVADELHLFFSDSTSAIPTSNATWMFLVTRIKKIFLRDNADLHVTNITADNFLRGASIEFFYSYARVKPNYFYRGCDAQSTSNKRITQIPLDLSICDNIALAFNLCKLDLETIENMADPVIGVKTVTDSPTTVIGVSLYKLSKDTSQETLEKYPLYTTGVTRYNENGQLLYVSKTDPTQTTTSTSQAAINEYILTSAEGKTDIATVEDVSSFTDDDWERYYGFPPASGTRYYATGPLLKALRTISDRGWNIDVQYN